MKKTVKYNGKNIKVNFIKINNNDRVVDEEKVFTTYTKITKSHGTYGFQINGKVFQVSWIMNFNQTASVQHRFEGFTCGDSEKKMIEHIISKYGL
jgi:hypothetical protein